MNKKLLITVGGTGGHVFPAITVAKLIKQQHPNVEILFVGAGLSGNRYFKSETFNFKDVSSGSISLRNPLKTLKNLLSIRRGIMESGSIIDKFKPDLIMGFGSYHTFPALIAAKWKKIPVILHEANRVPGKVNRLLAPYVDIIGVHFPDTIKLKGNIQNVSIPIRPGYVLGSSTKEEARKHFNLDADVKTVLVFGGSQGAKAINKLIVEAISSTNISNIQVLHFTGGDKEAAQLISNQYQQQNIKACVKEFESRMDLAWQAADLVICRSGAGTLAEQLEFEVPGILIPYPHAMDNHQEHNADFMVDVVGGAYKRLESELTSAKLARDIDHLLSQNTDCLFGMRKAMRAYKAHHKPDALSDVVIKHLQNI